jgi:two-component system chemotaxis response regulator CheY
MATNILVVDDSGTMRGMIKRTLAISGLDVGEVFEAANGIEALAQMDRHAISVVLLDINMPVMNGLQLLERIHDDPRLRGIPVIIASTEGSETRIRALLQAGARGYVRKPFRPEQLRDILTPIVGARTQPAAAGTDDDGSSF